MTFNTKRDRFFTVSIMISLLVIAVATLWPVVYEVGYAAQTDWIAVWIMIGLFILSVGFILWAWFDIEYTFHNDYLFVRGGPFRSKIPYKQITRVIETNGIFVGYRILSSKDALEIQYKTGLLGSVIISPEHKEQFVEELRKRSPLL
ncbi:PH domain-containing protein [Bacillus sp. FJAT-50079]|uniref:PH domain-containing protein n=1 Tax=Bacillus sp. FJAT-50079 TaxID=2833577 RepID=UPI001BC922A7|nr:PH domain-containing protein [Bacillus sp. FJAT-50079]MBS4207876.1 PH domain-containing protein [Bacillus sp. FJAT-50079]